MDADTRFLLADSFCGRGKREAETGGIRASGVSEGVLSAGRKCVSCGRIAGFLSSESRFSLRKMPLFVQKVAVSCLESGRFFRFSIVFPLFFHRWGREELLFQM